MTLYVNGQDIGRLVLGVLKQEENVWRWIAPPVENRVSPEEYLAAVDAFFKEKGISLDQCESLAVVEGLGSATALRTSHALINALAFAKKLPVYSVAKEQDLPDASILERLEGIQSRPYALPVYASAPHITTSNKDALKRSLPHG